MGSRSLTRATMPYIAANVAVAALVVWTSASSLDSARWSVLATWFLASVASEWLWLETITGQGTVSMALTFNFAAICLLPRDEAVCVVTAAVLVAALGFQRRAWYRVLFAGANVAIVVFISSSVLTALGGTRPSLETFWSLSYLGPVGAAGLTFFLTNTFGVSGAIALSERQSLLGVWRRNFGYGYEVLGTAALFLISPILVVTHLAVGWPAFVLLALPLVLIRKGNRDYIELQRTQDSVVAAERLAAKGEMAAGIAHELNNYLAALRGGTQLMARQLRDADTERVKRRLELVREQVDNMTVLTRGLMEFAHRDVTLAPTDLTALVERTITFLAPQRRFDSIQIRVTTRPLAPVHVDAAQIQQVLVNLLTNAADALREREGAKRVIDVTLEGDGSDHVRLAVRDEGEGMSEEVRARLFEPTFTTKPDGHGFGLATCQRIAANHGGKLLVNSAPGRGTTMTLVVPRAPSRRRISRPASRAPRERGGGSGSSRQVGS